ncbi:phosphatase PAP2 family protein [soil metagenome]
MIKKFLLFILSSGLFFLFVVFSYLVHKNIFTQLDFDTTVRLQNLIPRRLDFFFSLFSIFGGFEFSTIVLFFLVGIFVLFRKKILAILWIGLYGAFHVFELFGKTYVEQAPPSHFLLRTVHPVDFPQFYVSTDFSYPSGHSGRTVFFLTILLLTTWRNNKLTLFSKLLCTSVLLGYGGIMLVSRVYLGEHWLTDVIAGSIVGSSFGIAAYLLISVSFNFKRLSPKTLFFRE